MSFDQFGPACVLQYPYLWARQATAGETEGRKDRPTVVGFRLPRNDGQDLMILFHITSQSPSPERFAVEIPETERRRGGLDVNMRLWIILDEYNEDVVGRSYYLEPSALIGNSVGHSLSRSFANSSSAGRGLKASTVGVRARCQKVADFWYRAMRLKFHR